MLLFQDDDEARGLGVESAGDVFDGFGDDFFYAVVGDGGFGGELVIGSYYVSIECQLSSS